MKDWFEIARLYEKDSVFIAEAAQTLVRNIQYELPSVKKQTAKFEQLIEEAEKKIQDQSATETVLHAQRTAMCQKLGITGENLRNEFTAKLYELPRMYAEIATLASKLDTPLELYATASKNVECLPMLRHIIAKGNTTVYEYIHAEAPLSIEEPPIEIKLSIDNCSVNNLSGDGNNEVSAVKETRCFGCNTPCYYWKIYEL